MTSEKPCVYIPKNRSIDEKPVSTETLLDLVRAGDEEALAKLYDSHGRLVYSVALRVLRDPARAEDVLQDVFLKIWRKPDSFVAARGNLGPWLAIVARNRSIDVLRNHRKEDLCDDDVMAADDVFKTVETSLLIEKVRQAVPLLPSEHRRALEMAFFKGMTHTEIVLDTGMPLGTVKTRIRSALLFLAKVMRGTQSVGA